MKTPAISAVLASLVLPSLANADPVMNRAMDMMPGHPVSPWSAIQWAVLVIVACCAVSTGLRLYAEGRDKRS